VEWYEPSTLTHRAGPARALAADSGVRRGCPRVLGSSGLVAYATDVADEDRIEVSPSTRPPSRAGSAAARSAEPCRCSRHPGRQLRVVTHDGRICVMDTASGRVRRSDGRRTARHGSSPSRPTAGSWCGCSRCPRGPPS
jgi:hypothetical protein